VVNVTAPKLIGFGMRTRKTTSMQWIQKTALAGAAAAALLPLMAPAQYPGQVKKGPKDTPELRAVAVLEWTGDPGKPKACRIVPISVYDGEKLQDAGVYMARPQPLALSGEVEYELKNNGKTIGLFDIENAGQEQGSWVGYGKWKPLPVPKKPKEIAPEKVDEYADDKPVLHRKPHSADSSGSKGGSTPAASTEPSGPEDPDRPKLHKHDDSDNQAAAGAPPSPAGAPSADPDRPKLEKKPETPRASSPDPDRPSLQKPSPQLAADIGDVSSVNSEDPNRPKLKRGKSSGPGAELPPTLMGLPPDMQQAVAVSDAKNRPDHPWTFSWANPDDEKKMQAAMENIARQALGSPAPNAEKAPAPAPRKAGTPTHRVPKAPPAAPEPAPLADEQFRVFELAYGSGATMVLTAHDGAPAATRKFVTIIGQPDLYGNVRVLLKSVTDMAHLDETPRMRLVDAVDALADNRGELLFELRGEGSRQFALYRIYRGTVEKLFVSGGGVYGTISSE
jgi:hypothetical protein